MPKWKRITGISEFAVGHLNAKDERLLKTKNRVN
jgi:hypothetical protein